MKITELSPARKKLGHAIEYVHVTRIRLNMDGNYDSNGYCTGCPSCDAIEILYGLFVIVK